MLGNVNVPYTVLSDEIDAVVSIVDTMLVKIDFSSFISLPQTVSNRNITENHVLLNFELGTPSAQADDWTVTTSNGSVTVSGSISGSTTLRLILGKIDN